MKRYLLDTNIVSTLISSRRSILLPKLEQVGREAVYVNTIVAGELRFGAAKKGSARLVAEVEALLDRLEVVPLRAPIDRVYAELRASLERVGLSIGTNDLWIAAQALSAGSVVVTANIGEFGRVPGLTVENWLRP